VDADGDGEISFDEFVYMMRGGGVGEKDKIELEYEAGQGDKIGGGKKIFGKECFKKPVTWEVDEILTQKTPTTPDA
jgi:hypothetical protein